MPNILKNTLKILKKPNVKKIPDVLIEIISPYIDWKPYEEKLIKKAIKQKQWEFVWMLLDIVGLTRLQNLLGQSILKAFVDLQDMKMISKLIERYPFIDFTQGMFDSMVFSGNTDVVKFILETQFRLRTRIIPNRSGYNIHVNDKHFYITREKYSELFEFLKDYINKHPYQAKTNEVLYNIISNDEKPETLGKSKTFSGASPSGYSTVTAFQIPKQLLPAAELSIMPSKLPARRVPTITSQLKAPNRPSVMPPPTIIPQRAALSGTVTPRTPLPIVRPCILPLPVTLPLRVSAATAFPEHNLHRRLMRPILATQESLSSNVPSGTSQFYQPVLQRPKTSNIMPMPIPIIQSHITPHIQWPFLPVRPEGLGTSTTVETPNLVSPTTSTDHIIP